MNKLHSPTATVLLAVFLNIALAALFLWLTFNPPTFYGKAPERDLTYLIFVTYSVINFVTLSFFVGSEGPLGVFRHIVYGFNLLLVIGAVIFGAASALESIFSGPEILLTLFLLAPPLVTVAGFYSQHKHEHKYAQQGAQNGPR